MLLFSIVAFISMFFSQASCFVVVHNACTGLPSWNDCLHRAIYKKLNINSDSLSNYNIIASVNGHQRHMHSVELFAGLKVGDWARIVGKWVGEATHDSEWKKIPEAFLEGVEESEINARARNAKPMEELPTKESLQLPSAWSNVSDIKDVERVTNSTNQNREDTEGRNDKP